MTLSDDDWRVLEETSRTFFLPIRQLPAGLQEAIASAYLCMRAIDEIEDHPHLESAEKISLLHQISHALQAYSSMENFPQDAFSSLLTPHATCLPEVTLHLANWIRLAPPEIAPRIGEATATMAERMASWVGDNWNIRTENDLDR